MIDCSVKLESLKRWVQSFTVYFFEFNGLEGSKELCCKSSVKMS